MRVVLASRIVILWVGARFALLLGGFSTKDFLKVFSASMDRCREFLSGGAKGMLGQMYEPSRNIAESDLECPIMQDVHNYVYG